MMEEIVEKVIERLKITRPIPLTREEILGLVFSSE
jgi:hypothetical protein